MKRSEMLIILESILANLNSAVHGDGSFYEFDRLEKESMILKAIEEAGMLPPEQFRPVDYIDQIFEWDEEDE